MAIYFRARDRREVSASEALDARGLLRSGYGQRVSYAMRDGVSRLTDARSFWDQHRAELLVTDARRIGGVEGCRPGFRVFDADVGRAEREAAYREFEAYLNDSWRNPPPRDALDKKIKKYNARGQEEGYLETETEKDDAAVGDAKSKEDPPVGRDKCPECDGRGIVHGKTCQHCGGDGWVDDKDNNENGDDEDDGETATADGRMRDVQAVSAAHQQNMAKIYQQISADVSQRWRER